VSVHGLLYNWPAVMHGAASSEANPSGVQGVCPSGWHVPSHAEWEQLKYYVSNQSEYFCNNDSTYIGKALASTTGWNTSNTVCAIGNDPGSNNATGFNATPAGCRLYYGFYDLNYNAAYWSATNSYYWGFSYNSRGFSGSTGEKRTAYSVRCVRDE